MQGVWGMCRVQPPHVQAARGGCGGVVKLCGVCVWWCVLGGRGTGRGGGEAGAGEISITATQGRRATRQ